MRRAVLAVGVMLAAFPACGHGGGSGTHLSITYQMAKPCVHTGEEERLESRTAAGADVAYAIIYADRKIRGTPPRGTADGKGRFNAAWTVPPGTPSGQADVRILAAKGPATGNVVAHFGVGTCP